MADVRIPLLVCKSGVVFHSRPYHIMYLVLTFTPQNNWPACKLHDILKQLHFLVAENIRTHSQPAFPRTFSYVLIHSLSATTEQRTPVTLALVDAVASVSNLQFTDQDDSAWGGGGGGDLIAVLQESKRTTRKIHHFLYMIGDTYMHRLKWSGFPLSC